MLSVGSRPCDPLYPFVCLLCELNAWINNSIQDIRHEVREHYCDCQYHRCGLDNRIVAECDGSDGDKGDAGDIENRLDEKCAGHQETNRDADHGHQWDHSVA